MNVTQNEVNEVYIFWEYDQFPYVLGGTAEAVPNELGRHYVPAYQGSFKAVATFPVKTGKDIAAKLAKLKHERAVEIDAINGKFRKLANQIAPFN